MSADEGPRRRRRRRLRPSATPRAPPPPAVAPRPYKLHQNKPTPANGTGAREFYESLWKEKGLKSPMVRAPPRRAAERAPPPPQPQPRYRHRPPPPAQALAYLVEHGCLSDKELAKVAANYAALRKKGAASA